MTKQPASALTAETTDFAPRLGAVQAVLGRLEQASAPPAAQAFDALAEGILDAIFARDTKTLSEIARILRRIKAQWSARGDERGWSEALGQARASLVVAVGAADRLPSGDTISAVGAGTQGHQVLRALQRSESMSSGVLAERLGLRRDGLSRITATLMGDLLVTRVKLGREVFWELTPRGRDVLKELDTLDRANRARRKQRRSGVDRRRAGNGAEVIDLFSGAPLVINAKELETKRMEATSPREESWLMMLKLLAQRPSAISERLEVWDPLAQFASGDPSYLAVAPGVSDSHAREAPWKALSHVIDGKSIARHDWNILTPPRWDAFALVPGREGRDGIVLIEAKSHASELRARTSQPRRRSSRQVFERVLSETSEYLDASQPWEVWPPYPDAARRLAFLRYLLEVLGVQAWICNVYFVTPPYRDRKNARHLLASQLQWETRLRNVRDSLSIEQEHPLSPFIKHEYFVAP